MTNENETHTYRFIGSNHRMDGRTLERGDEVELTERQQRFFGHKFEPVDEDESAADETDADSADESPDYETYPRDELEEMEWSELRRLATESEAEAIDGRSGKGEILQTLAED